jgi:glycosyltransferase involved in cell wall biosynthesis
LAAAIKKLVDSPDLAARIGYTAKEDAKDYTYDKRAGKIIELIEELLRRTCSFSQKDTHKVNS